MRILLGLGPGMGGPRAGDTKRRRNASYFPARSQRGLRAGSTLGPHAREVSGAMLGDPGRRVEVRTNPRRLQPKSAVDACDGGA